MRTLESGERGKGGVMSKQGGRMEEKETYAAESLVLGQRWVVETHWRHVLHAYSVDFRVVYRF